MAYLQIPTQPFSQAKAYREAKPRILGRATHGRYRPGDVVPRSVLYCVGSGFSEKLLANLLRQARETEAIVLSLHQSAGEITRQMGSRDYACGHATLPVGQTGRCT